MSMRKRNRAVFIDRDGTINKEVEYLHRIEDLQLLSNTEKAVKKLNETGFLVIVISNQSGIARGYYTIEDMHAVNKEIERRLMSKGAYIDGFYYCPHHPKGIIKEYAVECTCRKPADALFLQASIDFNIDLRSSYAAGDRVRDLIPAAALGCKGYLVKTGYGSLEYDLLIEKYSHLNSQIKQAEDLWNAVEIILSDYESDPPYYNSSTIL